MKKIIIIAVFLTLGLIFKVEAVPVGGEYGYFYSNLAPYGSWIEINYGTLVWSPRIYDPNWAPYTAGQWIWTSYGWYWDSYEPFGYITYHYGRWYYDNYYGWLWVPDYQWAPAWVSWRYNDNYIGWSPLPPYASFSINIGIYFTTNYHVPYSRWHFVTYDYFCDPYVSKYYAAPKYKYRIFSKTRYRNNYEFSNGRVVNRGVDVDYIRKRTNQRIIERNINVISDPRKIRSGREISRDDNDVRAFIATKDELSRGGNRDFEIKRGKRESSLETRRIDFDGRNNVTPRVSGGDLRTRNNSNSRRHLNKRNIDPGNSRYNHRESRVEEERDIYIPKRETSINKRSNSSYRSKREDSHRIRTQTRMHEQRDQNRRIVPRKSARQKRETSHSVSNHSSQRRDNSRDSHRSRPSRDNNERRH